MAQLPLLDHFSSLDDPRQRGKVVYPLPEIMLVILCATLAGAEDFVEIRQWGRQKLRFLRTILPFARGIPSHDTLNDVMNALPGGLFSEMFAAWVEGLSEDAPDPVAPDVVAPDVVAPDVVAIDGKTSRRAHDGKNPALHVVSAWAARQRLVLGQEETQAKSNEISAIPLLLERLQLTGALVTIDAMGTQTRIAETILARGAGYLLALKDNQKSLAEEVALFFDSPEASALPVHQTTDADHGRLEIRRRRVSHDVAWLNGTRAAPGEPRFPRLKAIAMVEATTERDHKTTTARRYFLSSLPLDETLLALAVRAHWDIENRLHWAMDVLPRENDSLDRFLILVNSR